MILKRRGSSIFDVIELFVYHLLVIANILLWAKFSIGLALMVGIALLTFGSMTCVMLGAEEFRENNQHLMFTL